MTQYFVSPWGADANNGLGPDASHATNKPWLTIGKALGAAGIASGDTVYFCPGIYREIVTVNMTSATVETFVIGDVANGQGFKDGNGVAIPGGIIEWTCNTVNDWATTANVIVTLNGRDFLTFQSILFVGTNNGFQIMVQGSTLTSTDIKFQYCAFYADGQNTNCIGVSLAANVVSNWVIDSCLFFAGQQPTIVVSVDKPATADFDIVFVVKNCVFLAGAHNAVQIQQGATTNTFKFGGAQMFNCSMIGCSGSLMRTPDTNHSTSIPSAVYNCHIVSHSGTVAVSANTSGQIVEDYNLFSCQNQRTNVTAGAHSVSGTYSSLHEFGQSAFFGLLPRMPGLGSRATALGFGAQAGGPSVDILNKNRPAGVNLGSSGTATAGGNETLTDSGKSWGVNQLKGWTIKITGGTGSGQTKAIDTNTGTVITVNGNWKTNPSTDSTYVIYWGDLSSTGTATAGGASTLTDSNAAWGVNQWASYTIEIDGGTGSGQTATVASNTATVLTRTGTWTTNPDATSTYKLYKSTDENTQDYAVGAFERHDTAQKETTTTDAGGVAITLTGKSDHELRVPVDASLTTITLRCQFDSQHGTTNKPQAMLLANGEIGVSAETITAAGSADAWETLTFSDFTPTAKGWVIIRLVSRADAPAGRTFFDSVTVV